MLASRKFKELLEGEARKHDVKVRYHKRGAQLGRAKLDWKIVWVPTPARFASFFTVLHEVGHIAMGHKGGDGKPEYLWEFEAFSWARKYCEENRILVPSRTVDYEREIIAQKVREALEKKESRIVQRDVLEFISENVNSDDPDVEWVSRIWPRLGS